MKEIRFTGNASVIYSRASGSTQMHTSAQLPMTMQECLCVCKQACVCVQDSMCVCMQWKGQMGKREEQSQIKKDDSREKRRGEMGREGTWSGNASVPLRPATSYHGASTDRWMQESPIIEMLGYKRPDEGEELLHASWCVRMSGVARGQLSKLQLPISGTDANTERQVKTCMKSDLSQ